MNKDLMQGVYVGHGPGQESPAGTLGCPTDDVGCTGA